MVNLSFKEIQELLAEIAIIVIALGLIGILTVYPNQNSELFKDVLLIVVGYIGAILGSKALSIPTAREANIEEEEQANIEEEEQAAIEEDKVA
jgi:hypothetical protein